MILSLEQLFAAVNMARVPLSGQQRRWLD